MKYTRFCGVLTSITVQRLVLDITPKFVYLTFFYCMNEFYATFTKTVVYQKLHL